MWRWAVARGRRRTPPRPAIVDTAALPTQVLTPIAPPARDPGGRHRAPDNIGPFCDLPEHRLLHGRWLLLDDAVPGIPPARIAP